MNAVARWVAASLAVVAVVVMVVNLLDQRANHRAALERLEAAQERHAELKARAEQRHRDELAALVQRAEREQAARLEVETEIQRLQGLHDRAVADGAAPADPADCLVTPVPGEWIPERWRP